MSPERTEKLRHILRLATRLADDERSHYLDAVTNGDDEMRRVVDAFFTNTPAEEQTFQTARPTAPATATRPLKFSFATRRNQDEKTSQALDMVSELSKEQRAALTAAGIHQDR